MSYVTGISGNQISAAYAGYAPTNSADVSAIASAYATGAEQVVTSLQYYTSDTIQERDSSRGLSVGYTNKYFSADYLYGLMWEHYWSGEPVTRVTMHATSNNYLNYSAYPFYLYFVPYGTTNYGNVSDPGEIAYHLEEYGAMGLFDCQIAEGHITASDPTSIDLEFDVSSLPVTEQEDNFTYWGFGNTGVSLSDSTNATPVFGVVGGNNEWFLESDFADKFVYYGLKEVHSSVSGINSLGIYDSGVGYTVSAYSADWNSAYSLVSGVTALLDAI